MDRVTDFESGGCAFDPRRGRSVVPPMDSSEELKLIQLLLDRLERVSVDSYWAHRASGIRGGLIKTFEEREQGIPAGQGDTALLISSAFEILTHAAKEKC